MTDPAESTARRRVTLEDLFGLLARGLHLELRVTAPATVTAFAPPAAGPYGPLPAMVEVELDQEAARYGREGDADPTVPERFKPVGGALDGEGELVGKVPPFWCPVKWTGQAGGLLRGPLLPGEGGLVHFTDRALGRWLVAGRAGGLTVDPGEGATHGENLCDAFFVPGARSGPTTIPGSVPAEGVSLGSEDNLTELHLGTPESHLVTAAPTLTLDALAEVLIGKAGATDFIAKANPLVAILTQLAADLGAWVPVAMDGGAALKTILSLPGGTLETIAAQLSQISATKGKVE